MIVSMDIQNIFAKSLRTHIQYVTEAGQMLGVPEWRLAIHDATKWMECEFFAYAQHFHGGGCPKEFSVAWLHHIHHNSHHWQHWMFPDGYSPDGSGIENGVIEMPPDDALEMIADWMGASKGYTGSFDMKDWLWKNIPCISLHSNTSDYVRGVLDHQGYADVVYVRPFAQEIKENKS